MLNFEVPAQVIHGLVGIWVYSAYLTAVFVAIRLRGCRAYCRVHGLPASLRDVVALLAVGVVIVLAAPVSLVVLVVRHAPHPTSGAGACEEFP